MSPDQRAALERAAAVIAAQQRELERAYQHPAQHWIRIARAQAETIAELLAQVLRT